MEALGVSGGEITLIGFLVVAVLAVGVVLLTHKDRKRIIRFGFFLEHERDKEFDAPTDPLWPGEEKEDGEE